MFRPMSYATITHTADIAKNFTYHGVDNLRARYPTGQSAVAFHLRHDHMVQTISWRVEHASTPGSSIAVAVAPGGCMFRRDGN